MCCPLLLHRKPRTDGASVRLPLGFRNEKEVDIAIDELTFTVWHEGKCLVKIPVFEEGTGQIIAYLDRGGTDKVYFDKGLDKFRLHSGCENRIPKQG